MVNSLAVSHSGTTVEFRAPNDGRVVVTLLDPAGKEAATLFDGAAEKDETYSLPAGDLSQFHSIVVVMDGEKFVQEIH